MGIRLFDQSRKCVPDPTMAMDVKIICFDELDDIIDGFRVDQDRTQQRFFCIPIMRHCLDFGG